MSSFCLGCGKSLATEERFCGNCGRDSQTNPTTPRVDPSVAYGIPPETSGKAIFSLISGILLLFFPFAVAAVVFGYIALYEIRKSGGRLTGRGLAISGIVLGYLGVVFFLGIMGLGIYGMRQNQKFAATYKSESTTVSAMRNFNMAEIAYSQAHRDAGYTCSLLDLSSAWAIGDLKKGYTNQYVFEVRGCARDKQDGPITRYQVIAYPSAMGKQKLPAYCSDQSYKIRIASNGAPEDCLDHGRYLTERELTATTGASSR